MRRTTSPFFQARLGADVSIVTTTLPLGRVAGVRPLSDRDPSRGLRRAGCQGTPAEGQVPGQKRDPVFAEGPQERPERNQAGHPAHTQPRRDADRSGSVGGCQGVGPAGGHRLPPLALPHLSPQTRGTGLLWVVPARISALLRIRHQAVHPTRPRSRGSPSQSVRNPILPYERTPLWGARYILLQTRRGRRAGDPAGAGNPRRRQGNTIRRTNRPRERNRRARGCMEDACREIRCVPLAGRAGRTRRGRRACPSGRFRGKRQAHFDRPCRQRRTA